MMTELSSRYRSRRDEGKLEEEQLKLLRKYPAQLINLIGSTTGEVALPRFDIWMHALLPGWIPDPADLPSLRDPDGLKLRLILWNEVLLAIIRDRVCQNVFSR
jgi:hypothetical protein